LVEKKSSGEERKDTQRKDEGNSSPFKKPLHKSGLSCIRASLDIDSIVVLKNSRILETPEEKNNLTKPTDPNPRPGSTGEFQKKGFVKMVVEPQR